MKDRDKSKGQLLQELRELRERFLGAVDAYQAEPRGITDLRRKAEGRFRKQHPKLVGAMADADLHAIVHELQVYQIELEMQNEELVKAQVNAQELSEKYGDLFDSAPIGYYLWDALARILEVNLSGAALLGLDRSTTINRRFGQFVVMDDRLAFSEFCTRVFQTDAKQHCEVKLRIADQSVQVLIEAITVRGRKGEHGCCRAVVMDITERKTAEDKYRQLWQQLTHVARLSTMGEMVAGIAHELNQPLHSIATLAKACSNVLSQDQVRLAPLREWNQAIAAAAVRGGKIIKGLRAFVSKSVLRLVPTAIGEVLEESFSFFAFEMRYHQVNLHAQIDAADLVVRIDRVQIQQVLVNLLQNACEALEEKTEAARHVWIHVTEAGKFVDVSVADNGPGLKGCDVAKIFDPFFTTKPNGMGMGLAISRTIVEAHGGQIWVAPATTGTVAFHFTLPVAAERSSDAQ
jgi:PAS domain S-box-containing protein